MVVWLAGCWLCEVRSIRNGDLHSSAKGFDVDAVQMMIWETDVIDRVLELMVALVYWGLVRREAWVMMRLRKMKNRLHVPIFESGSNTD